MRSHRRPGPIPPFIGVDLTDRYGVGATLRRIDVCGLTPIGHGFRPTFWTWEWRAGQSPLDARSIMTEIAGARCTFIDGPQALATPGAMMRICERECGAAGKTPCDWEDLRSQAALRKPFAGYVLSSLEFFRALHEKGLVISPDGFAPPPPQGAGWAGEFYPGDLWRRLAAPRVLLNKETPGGRAARTEILRRLGVAFRDGDSFTHDQLDACLGAVLAAAADRRIEGVGIRSLGQALTGPDEHGHLREGPMAIFDDHSDSFRDAIRGAIRDEWCIAPSPSRSAAVGQEDSGPRRSPSRRRSVAASPDISGKDTRSRASELHDWLIECYEQGKPTLITYKVAHRYLSPDEHWSRSCTGRVVSHAEGTEWRAIHGLGEIRLDGFVVSSKTHRPGDGHWRGAPYDQDEWDAAFSDARVIDPRSLDDLLGSRPAA